MTIDSYVYRLSNVFMCSDSSGRQPPPRDAYAESMPHHPIEPTTVNSQTTRNACANAGVSPHSKGGLKWKIIIPMLVTIAASALNGCNSQNPAGPSSSFETPANSLVYTNNTYGFRLILPDTWAGYTVTDNTFGSDAVSAEASISGVETSVDCAQILLFSPQYASNSDVQPVIIIVFKLSDWTTFDLDTEGPDYRQVVTSAGGAEGSQSLGQNNQYVFSIGTREYGFQYTTGVDEAQAISGTISAFDI